MSLFETDMKYVCLKEQSLSIEAINGGLGGGDSDCSTYFAKNKTQLFYYHLKIDVLVPIITGHVLVRFYLFIIAYSIFILASNI